MVNDALLVALTVGIPAFVTSLAALVASIRATAKVGDLHVLVNSRMDKLLVSTHGEGVAVGRAAERSIARAEAEQVRQETRADVARLAAAAADATTVAAAATIAAVAIAAAAPPPTASTSAEHRLNLPPPLPTKPPRP